MLVASVHVRFRAYGHDSIEMMDVYMHKDSVEPGEYLLALGLECLGKGNVCRDGEKMLVIDLGLDPIHQQRHVFCGWEVGRLFVLFSILPQVLELRASRHGGTGLGGALFANCPINEIDPVEEIHHMDSQPIIRVFALWKFDDLSEIYARVETGLSLFMKGIFKCARLELFLGSKCLLFIENRAKV